MSRCWMPLYVGDYLADTKHLTTLQHGAYLLLIMHYWQHGELPTDVPHLRQICSMTGKQWLRNSEAIAKLFLPGWKHKRIEAELEKARILSEKRAILGAIGGRRNKGLNNQQRHLRAINGEAIAKQTVAQSQSHIERKKESGEKELAVSSALADIVRARGWAP